MMKKILTTHKFLVTTFLACNVFLVQFHQANAFETSKYLKTIVEPKPIKRIHPKYPLSAAKGNLEGWAKVSFVIDKQGEVSNVLVTETSGNKNFGEAAKKAVLQWRYKPAIENGEAIQQCINNIQFDFKIKSGNKQGVSARFRNMYARATDAFNKKQYDELDTKLKAMKKARVMHILESDYMHLLEANYAKVKNNKTLQLFHLQRVTLEHDPKRRANSLYQTFMLEVELNQFRAAHRTYKKLSKLESAQDFMPNVKKIMTRVHDFIASENDLVIKAKIKNKDYWSTALVRNEFSLTEINGSLDKLDIRCSNKRHVFTVEDNNIWKIPAEWKNCSIYVFGEPNTSFSLIEHPQKS